MICTEYIIRHPFHIQTHTHHIKRHVYSKIQNKIQDTKFCSFVSPVEYTE